MFPPPERPKPRARRSRTERRLAVHYIDILGESGPKGTARRHLRRAGRSKVACKYGACLEALSILGYPGASEAAFIGVSDMSSGREMYRDRFGIEPHSIGDEVLVAPLASQMARRCHRAFRPEKLSPALLEALLACAQSAPSKSDL
ncbi:MAG: hypothetical protein EXQ85_06690 [Alphaproteobacteria bacterium]|nr:hypothetical protein [Alphaproteobacteria bacterium]